MNNFYFIILVCFLYACNSGKSDADDISSKLIAKAGNENLNFYDFKTDFISNGNKKDSALSAIKTIENWATEALFYQEAISKLNSDEIEIDKQVQSYKKSLVNYIYQTKLIEANLDTIISIKEIQNYYNAHRDNFILKSNIIRLDYLKIPAKFQGLEKMKQLLKSNQLNDKEKLNKLCVQNAENFYLNDSTWLYIDDIKKEIPKLKTQADITFSSGQVIEFTDADYYFYIKIKDIKIKNGISPLNFEKQNIKKFIINNRKMLLINEYKQLLLENAKTDKSFIVY